MTPPLTKGTSTTTSPHARAQGRSRLAGAALAMILAVPFAAPAAASPTTAPTTSVSALPAAARTESAISARVSTTEIRPNEAVFFRGRVYAGAQRSPVGRGVEVVLMRQAHGQTSWSVVERVHTSSSGRFTARDRPYRAFTYRLKVSSKGDLAPSYTDPVKVLRTKATRNLSDRARTLRRAGQLGDATSGLRRDGRAVHQDFERGTLVRVTKSAGTRTWLVEKPLVHTYRKQGGASGRLGVPVHDMRCDLPEGGCLQRFTGGSLHYSPSTGVTVGLGKGRVSEGVAVGLSQVGYREPTWRHSKYNTWAGSTRAWCGIFQSWIAWASQNEGAVPFRKSFPDLVPAIRAEGRKVSKPRRGDLVLFSFTSSRTPSHVGMVLNDKGSTVRVLDGNTTSGKGSLTRGVFIRERSKHYALGYYRMNW